MEQKDRPVRFCAFRFLPLSWPFCRAKACTRARPFVSCVSRQVHRGTVIIVSRQMEGLRVPPTALEAHRAACNSAIASPPNKYPMIDFNWALPILPPPSTSRFSSRSRISRFRFPANLSKLLAHVPRYPVSRKTRKLSPLLSSFIPLTSLFYSYPRNYIRETGF